MPLLAVVAALIGCGSSDGGSPDKERITEFDRFPTYWWGETYRGHDLAEINDSGESGIAPGISYGELECVQAEETRESCDFPYGIGQVDLCQSGPKPVLGRRHRGPKNAALYFSPGGWVLLTGRTAVIIQAPSHVEARRAAFDLIPANQQAEKPFPPPVTDVFRQQPRC